MSERNEITIELVQNISLSILENDSSKLNNLIANLHIADIAEILKNIPVSQAQFLYHILEEEKSAEILMQLDDSLREDLLSDLSAKEIAKEVKLKK